MMFNRRRQSRDKALIEDIGKLCADGVVFISDFSLPLFEDGVADVIAVSNPLSAAGEEIMHLLKTCSSEILPTKLKK
jgi:hypothetical protein